MCTSHFLTSHAFPGDRKVYKGIHVCNKYIQILQNSLRSLCRILHRVVFILYCTALEMLLTTSRDTLKISRPSLISSSNIWIACTSRVCAAETSVTITVSLKSLPAWKDVHKYIQLHTCSHCSSCLMHTSRCLRNK